MILYRYDSITGEYLGSENAFEDPRRPGRVVDIPYTTSLEPPTCRESEIVIFQNDNWVIQVLETDTTSYSSIQNISPEIEIKQSLVKSDLGFIRVIEDIISILKDIYNIDIVSHLPEDVQTKLENRQNLRNKLKVLSSSGQSKGG